ncbi:hypothetical protein M5K25_024230 [Dendrobium thyrsiflorum]|uniref:Uncharacterized protein n=1 Tax=Dendrobium thyrsiflorum TaxID=117978 RepID=A0ABD0U1F5_DENTH
MEVLDLDAECQAADAMVEMAKKSNLFNTESSSKMLGHDLLIGLSSTIVGERKISVKIKKLGLLRSLFDR